MNLESITEDRKMTRRGFIGALGAAVTGLAAYTGLSQAYSAEPKEKPKVPTDNPIDTSKAISPEEYQAQKSDKKDSYDKKQENAPKAPALPKGWAEECERHNKAKQYSKKTPEQRKAEKKDAEAFSKGLSQTITRFIEYFFKR